MVSFIIDVQSVNFYYFFTGGELGKFVISLAVTINYYSQTFGEVYPMPQWVRFLTHDMDDRRAKLGERTTEEIEAPYYEAVNGTDTEKEVVDVAKPSQETDF